MVNNRSNTSSLGPKAVAILRDHLATFRITTYEVLEHLYFKSRNSAVQWVKRHEKDRHLQGALLHDAEGRTKYWFLTVSGARRFSLPPSFANAPAAKLPRYYGMLLFCCLGGERGKPRYKKLTPPAFTQRFPDLAPKTQMETPESYYLDHDFAADGRPPIKRIGYLLVDTSRELRTLLHKYNKVVRSRLKIPKWVLLAERERFLITILSPDPDRAQQIREALDREPRPVCYRIEVVPQLDNVIPYRVKHAAKR